MNIGERIRDSRLRSNMLQRELAAKIGVKSSGIISNWERGMNKPNAEQIVALCEALNVTASYLLGYNGKIDFEVNPDESVIILKLRSLDAYGLKSILGLIDNEVERCREQGGEQL